MTSATAVAGILRADGLRVRRDRFLLGMALYIVAISIALRWALPWVAGEVDSRLRFDLLPYYPLIVSHIVVQLAPLLGAIIGGFLLIEGREDRTLKALLTSPVPLPVYLSVLCSVLIAGSAVLIVLESSIIGLALPPALALLGATAAGAPAAGGLALVIATLAGSKTEAFAYMKIVGLGPVAASGFYFVPEPWQWLAAVYPPYAASKAYWVAEAGGDSWWLWVVVGLVGSAMWFPVLTRWFLKAARR